MMSLFRSAWTNCTELIVPEIARINLRTLFAEATETFTVTIANSRKWLAGKWPKRNLPIKETKLIRKIALDSPWQDTSWPLKWTCLCVWRNWPIATRWLVPKLKNPCVVTTAWLMTAPVSSERPLAPVESKWLMKVPVLIWPRTMSAPKLALSPKPTTLCVDRTAMPTGNNTSLPSFLILELLLTNILLWVTRSDLNVSSRKRLVANMLWLHPTPIARPLSIATRALNVPRLARPRLSVVRMPNSTPQNVRWRKRIAGECFSLEITSIRISFITFTDLLISLQTSRVRVSDVSLPEELQIRFQWLWTGVSIWVRSRLWWW